MSEGVLYLHAGSKCVSRLAVSLSSLRDHWTGPVAVFNHGDLHPAVSRICSRFDVSLRQVDYPSRRVYVKKVHAACNSPFERTLFLDADTFVRSPLDQFFEWIRQHSTVMVNFANWRTTGRIVSSRIRRWSELYPGLIDAALQYGIAINTGSFGVTAGSEFLEQWLETTVAGDQSGIPLTDELAAQIVAPQHPHYLAPPEWGYSVRFGEKVSPPDTAKIAHYHGSKHITDNGVGHWWQERFRQLQPDLRLEPWGDKRLSRWMKGWAKEPAPAPPPAPVQSIARPEPAERQEDRTGFSVEPWKPVEGEEWIDIVTTVVARGTVEEALGSFVKHFDFGGVKTRWLVHLDRCDAFPEEKWEETIDQLNRIAPRFDHSELFIAPRWRGHGGSLKVLFDQVRNDMIIWEDDKRLGRDCSIRGVYAHEVQFFSFVSGRHAQVGATSPSFWRKSMFDYLMDHWRPEFETGDVEFHMMDLLKPVGFSFAGCRLRPTDIGLDANADMHVARIRDEKMGGARFEAVDDRVTVVTACDAKYRDRLKGNWHRWEWHLNVLSYPMILYYDPDSVSPESFSWMKNHPRLRMIPWSFPIAGSNQREKMLSAFVFGPAEHVETTHWLKLDADTAVVKTEGRNLKVIDEDWFKFFVVGHRWGYTKVKGDPGQTRHWMNILDDWWAGIFEGTDVDVAPLFPPDLVVGEKFKCSRINSYVSLYQTEFTKGVAALCGERLPVPSQDTVMWYVAQRMGKNWHGVNMKARGLHQ